MNPEWFVKKNTFWKSVKKKKKISCEREFASRRGVYPVRTLEDYSITGSYLQNILEYSKLLD